MKMRIHASETFPVVGSALRWVAEPEALPVDSLVIVGPLAPLGIWMVAAEQAVGP